MPPAWLLWVVVVLAGARLLGLAWRALWFATKVLVQHGREVERKNVAAARGGR